MLDADARQKLREATEFRRALMNLWPKRKRTEKNVADSKLLNQLLRLNQLNQVRRPNEPQWSKSLYSDVKARLIGSRNVENGRTGRSVKLSESGALSGGEKTIYEPLRCQIERWLYTEVHEDESYVYDHVVVEITGEKGKQKTGGKWTRPDILAAAKANCEFLPTPVMDLISFEVKVGSESLGSRAIEGVFEARAHQRRANYAWLVIAGADHEQFDQTVEAKRIRAEAREEGIGIILAKHKDFLAWEILLRPVRRTPSDPKDLNECCKLFKENQDTVSGWWGREPA